MSLIAWLPLNNSIENQGLENLVISSSSLTYSTGKVTTMAASFNGSSSKINTTINCTNNMTFTCWVKFNSSTAAYIIDCRNLNSYGYQPFYGGVNYGVQIHTAPNVSANWSAAECNLTVGTWYHFALIYSEEYCELFIDGVSKGKKFGNFGAEFDNCKLSLGARWSDENWLNGQINDFRIYDEVLSDEEIYKLSRGLCLHYDFSGDAIWPQNNIVTAIYPTLANYDIGKSDLLTNQAAGTQSITIFKNKKCNKMTFNGSSNRYYFSQSIQAGTYCFQMDYYNTVSKGNALHIELNGGSHLWDGGDAAYTTPGRWQRLIFWYTANTDTTAYLFVQGNTGNTAYATNFSISKHATVTDNSGYNVENKIIINNSNATLIESPSINSNALSLLAANTSDYSSVSGAAYLLCDFNNSFKLDTFTIAFWANITQYGIQTSGVFSFSSYSSSPSDYETNGIHQYDNYIRFNLSNGSKSLTATDLFKIDEWHFYTIKYDGTKLYTYRDGNEIKKIDASGYLKDFRYIYLGLNCAGGAWRKAITQWADFKLFAMALSEQDIKNLYTSRISIQNGILNCDEYTTEYLDASYSSKGVISASSIASGDKNCNLALYTQLEYIESDGTQYIDTGIDNTIDDYKLELKQAFTSLAGDHISGLSGNAGCGIGLSSGNWWLDSATPISSATVNTIYNLTWIKNGANCTRIIDNDSYSIDRANTTNPSNYHIYLFAAQAHQGDATITYKSYSKLYSAKLYLNNLLVRNFIPVKRNLFGDIGLYDTVENKFYGSATIYPFIAGPEIGRVLDCNKLYIGQGYNCRPIEESDFDEVEYIESTGTQYIDTGYVASNTTKIDINTMWLSNSGSYQSIFGASRPSNTWGGFGFVGPYVEYNTNDTNVQALTANTLTNIVLDNNKFYIDGTLTYTFTSGTFNTLTTYLLGYNSNGNLQTTRCRVYSCKIYDNSMLVRDFIPAVRNIDGKPGLFDRVEKRFYTNSGSGEFITGQKIFKHYI